MAPGRSSGGDVTAVSWHPTCCGTNTAQHTGKCRWNAEHSPYKSQQVASKHGKELAMCQSTHPCLPARLHASCRWLPVRSICPRTIDANSTQFFNPVTTKTAVCYNTAPGDTCTVDCQEGFYSGGLTPTVSAQCFADGQWNFQWECRKGEWHSSRTLTNSACLLCVHVTFSMDSARRHPQLLPTGFKPHALSSILSRTWWCLQIAQGLHRILWVAPTLAANYPRCRTSAAQPCATHLTTELQLPASWTERGVTPTTTTRVCPQRVS